MRNNYSGGELELCRFTDEVPSNMLVTNTLIACSLYGLIFVPVVLLNGISILTILRSSQLKQKVCYFVILLQSIVDFIFGVIGLPLMMAHFIDRDISLGQNVVICWLHYTIGYYLMGLSLIMLVGLSFERYMGVMHPFIHRTKVTKRRIFVFVCCLGLIFPIGVVPLSSASTRLSYHASQTMILMLLAYLVYVYTSIFVTARKRLDPRNRPGALAAVENSTDSKWKRRFLKDLKLAKSCFLVVCTFGICFLPTAVLLVPGISEKRETDLILWAWAYLLSSLNSCLNSLIFFWFKPMLRKEAKKVLKIL